MKKDLFANRPGPTHFLACPDCGSAAIHQIASAHLYRERTDVVFECDFCGKTNTLCLVKDGRLTVVEWANPFPNDPMYQHKKREHA